MEECEHFSTEHDKLQGKETNRLFFLYKRPSGQRGGSGSSQRGVRRWRQGTVVSNEVHIISVQHVINRDLIKAEAANLECHPHWKRTFLSKYKSILYALQYFGAKWHYSAHYCKQFYTVKMEPHGSVTSLLVFLSSLLFDSSLQ